MNDIYDSTEDTRIHIGQVQLFVGALADEMRHRVETHDASKLGSPEKATFDRVTPSLKALTYDSEEYKASLAEMKSALDHHYAHNRHHPEHFGDAGMCGMTLIDLLEMFCDWCAATERHADGDIFKSISANAKRFGYDIMLSKIFSNTARAYRMGRQAESAERGDGK